MALDGVMQPEILPVNDSVRLRKFDGRSECFLPGYQDPVVYQNSEGIFDTARIPDLEYVQRMCKYLANVGELYYIEALEDGHFTPIGDVTIKPENPPIAIWCERYRANGIGTAVLRTVIERLRNLGYSQITGSTVYSWNISSQKLHEKLGFRRTSENEREIIYALDIDL